MTNRSIFHGSSLTAEKNVSLFCDINEFKDVDLWPSMHSRQVHKFCSDTFFNIIYIILIRLYILFKQDDSNNMDAIEYPVLVNASFTCRCEEEKNKNTGTILSIYSCYSFKTRYIGCQF